MYGNNFNQAGGYYPTHPNAYQNGQYYTSPPAGAAQPPGGPMQGVPQYGPASPYPGVPGYANEAPRPVHRRVVPPATMFEPDPQRRLAARFTSSNTAPEPLNPFTPLASLPPSSHYLQPAPTLLYNPFYVRPASPDPSQFQYTRDELSLLRDAGFHREDRERLTVVPDRQFRFVMDNANWLAERGFTPNDTLNTARLAPSQRSFVAHEAYALDRMGFLPGQMNDLALMAQSERTFVLRHGEHLQAAGFSPLQAMLLATRPSGERGYVVVYGMALRDRGYSVNQIRQQARDPSRRPDLASRPTRQAAPPPASLRMEPEYPQQTVVRAPRRVSTSELPRRQATAAAPENHRSSRRHRTERERTPRRSATTPAATLTTAERQGFQAIGLAPEALDRLTRSSDTVRTYVLAHGGNLLASGMSFEEIVTMAEDSSGTADTRPAPHRTRSPIQMEPQNVTHPRNHAPLSQSESATLAHAYTRWSHGHTSRAAGEDFYRNTVPQALCQKLATPEPYPGAEDNGQAGGYPNLSLLLAGVAYAEDNRNAATAPQHQARVKALTDYLANTEDPELLRNGDSAAAEGVTHCGDRVAYGLTRVEQVVMQHKIQHGAMPPRKMFESIESVFLQPRIENIATYLANARKVRGNRAATTTNYTRESFAAQVEQAVDATFSRSSGNAGGGIRAQVTDAFRSMLRGGATRSNTTVTDNSAAESLEMYAALAPLLIQSGVNLVESAHSSTYGGMYRIEPLEIDYARNEINRHVRDLSDDFLQEFEGNSAVEKLLRQCFQQDFRTMREEREDLQDQADDALFDADAPEGTQAMVRDTMTALATMEKDWYREKLKVVLAQRHLLDDLPPLAPDLAAD